MPTLNELSIETEASLRRIAKTYRAGLPDLATYLTQWIREHSTNDLLSRSEVSLQLVYGLIDRAGLKKYFEFDPLLNLAVVASNQKMKALGVELSSGLEAPSLAGLEAALSGAGAQAALQPVRDEANLKLKRIRDNVASQVQQILVQMQAVPTPITAAAQQLSRVSELSRGQAATIINTAMGATLQTIQLKAGERMEKRGVEVLYIYAGPDDSLDRPFCSRIVGLAFTKKQIGKLNNGQGLSVASTGGGYNCRHEWVAVPASYVERRGIKRATEADIRAANGAAKR